MPPRKRKPQVPPERRPFLDQDRIACELRAREQLLSVRELGVLCNLGESTMSRIIRGPKGPRAIRLGGSVRITPADALEWLYDIPASPQP